MIRFHKVIALAFVVTLAIGATNCAKETGIGVNAVRTNPAILNGTVTLKGVVGAFSKEPGIFGLMDVAELSCNAQNCNKFFVPVKVDGVMPKIGDEVLVTGLLVDAPGGKLFAAAKMKTIRNHKI
jgi:hypothetical protein